MANLTMLFLYRKYWALTRFHCLILNVASKGVTITGRKPGDAETDASETTDEDAATRSDSGRSHIYTTATSKFNNSRSSSWNM